MRRPLLVGLLLAATALRAAPLTDNRFHPDEALYATFARLIATGRDPWLASVVVDKPPLPFYLAGGAMTLLGTTELAARLPNLFASIASLPLLYGLGRRLYGRPVAGVALLVYALCPFAISFGATAFLDPLHTAFVLWAALAAAAGKWGWAGLATGLALSVKQTTLAFLPLLVWLLLAGTGAEPLGPVTGRTTGLRRAGAFLGPIALSAAVISAWDFARRPRIGFWAQGYSDNVPGRLIHPAEMLPRLDALGRLLSYLTASMPLDILVVIGLAGLLLSWRAGPVQASRPDLTLAGFVLAFLGVYWLGAFNLWDRYFLVLVPFICLLVAHALSGLARRLTSRPAPLAAAVVLIFLTRPAVIAARSGYPIGGDHGAYDGIDQVAQYLRPIPKGAVLYDHWLSWELRYYLDDAPIFLVWMPDPAMLKTDLQAFGRVSPRYFVSPSWESDAEFKQAAAVAGFAFEEVYTTRRRDGTISFIVYRLAPIDT